jgi:hypothetical protein
MARRMQATPSRLLPVISRLDRRHMFGQLPEWPPLPEFDGGLAGVPPLLPLFPDVLGPLVDGAVVGAGLAALTAAAPPTRTPSARSRPAATRRFACDRGCGAAAGAGEATGVNHCEAGSGAGGAAAQLGSGGGATPGVGAAHSCSFIRILSACKGWVDGWGPGPARVGSSAHGRLR